MYELARKHCGQQAQWKISLEVLKKKCGSASTVKEFKRLVQNVCKENQVHDHFPDYGITLDGQMVSFSNRKLLRPKEEIFSFPRLDPDTYHEARLVAPGLDVYWLEEEWKQWWLSSGKPELFDPERAFIGFCKKRFENRQKA